MCQSCLLNVVLLKFKINRQLFLDNLILHKYSDIQQSYLIVNLFIIHCILFSPWMLMLLQLFVPMHNSCQSLSVAAIISCFLCFLDQDTIFHENISNSETILDSFCAFPFSVKPAIPARSSRSS